MGRTDQTISESCKGFEGRVGVALRPWKLFSYTLRAMVDLMSNTCKQAALIYDTYA